MLYHKKMISFIIIAVFLFGSLARAAGFEGKIVNRDISIPAYAFPSLGEIENTDSDAYRSAVQELFKKSPDELKQMAQANGGGDDIQESISTIYIKGSKFRIDSEEEGEKQSIIYDLNTKSMNIIQWDSRVVITSSLDELKQGLNEMIPEIPEMENPDVSEEKSQFFMKAAGKTRKINGYSCDLYTGINDEGNYTNLWITSENQVLFDAFRNMITVMQESFEKGKMLGEEEKFFIEKKAVDILNMTASSFDIDIQEMKDIQAQSLSDDLFKIPAGFQKINAAEMMQQQMEMYKNQH